MRKILIMFVRIVPTVTTLLLAVSTLGLTASAVDNQGLIWSLETVIQKEMEENHAPGAALVLVKDGQVIYCQDMGRFITMLLQEGRYGKRQLLSEETVETMFRRQASIHPGLDGVTCGFMEQHMGGRRFLVRDGSGLSVRSQIFLLPEENFGYFYVQNCGGDQVIGAIQKNWPGTRPPTSRRHCLSKEWPGCLLSGPVFPHPLWLCWPCCCWGQLQGLGSSVSRCWVGLIAGRWEHGFTFLFSL